MAGPVRRGRGGQDCNPRDQSGDPRRDGRHNPLASQLFHEQFRKLGFVDYKGGSGLQVNSSLLNAILYD